MASTTATTMAGYMERIQADAIGRFIVGSRFWPGIYPVASNNADVIQFPAVPPPSPVTSATADGDAITDSAKSAAAKTLIPVQIGDATKISTRALLGGFGVRDANYAQMINNVIGGADYIISGQLDDFTDASNVIATASWSAFQVSISDLLDVGYGNDLVAALSIRQWQLILASAGSIVIPNINEKYFTSLDVFRIGGCDVLPCSSGLLRTDTNKVGAIWHRNFLGFGYHVGDTVSEIMQGTGSPAPLVHLKEVPVDVLLTNLSAAVLCNATEIHASGGVAIKYALT